MTFKERNRDLQELVRELTLLRNNNLAIKPGDAQDKLLFFAEAAVLLMTLERFLRILPGVGATDQDTLPNLLEKATSDRHGVLKLPTKERNDAIRRIKDIRNTILHCNFEQAAKQAGISNVRDYFLNQFAPEVESLYKLTDHLFKQIDPKTGERVQN